MSGRGTTRWWWIRHAPVPNPEGRVYGQRDVVADVSDLEALTLVARRLPAEAVWVTSWLRRTRDTAAAIRSRREALAQAPEPIVERDLAEQNFGDWHGRTYVELGAFGLGRDGRSGHRYWLCAADQVPPGGESFTMLCERVGAAIDRLSEIHAGRDLVVVAHGGTIRAALVRALDLAPEAALGISIDTLSVTRVDRIDTPLAGHAWRVGPVNLPARETLA